MKANKEDFLKIKDVIKLAEEIDKSVLKDEDKIEILMHKINVFRESEDIEKIIDDAIVEMRVYETVS